MVNFLNLQLTRGDNPACSPTSQAEYVSMVTRMGRIKRVKLSEFARRPSGIIAVNWNRATSWAARATHGHQDYIIVTGHGRALRYNERSCAMGRAGVLAIRLVEGDAVAAFDIVEPGGELLVLTERGWGKRTPLAQYPIHSRNSQGIWALAHTKLDQTGTIAAARVVQPTDQVSIITAGGIAWHPGGTISQLPHSRAGALSPDHNTWSRRWPGCRQWKSGRPTRQGGRTRKASSSPPATEFSCDLSCATAVPGGEVTPTETLRKWQHSTLSYASQFRGLILYGSEAREADPGSEETEQAIDAADQFLIAIRSLLDAGES
jgi:hypothetical protein